MKKVLITILPILVILFSCVWIVFGLKYAIAYLIAILITIPITIILMLGIFKWIEFVDKHIKD